MRIRRSITGIAGLFLLGSTVMTGCAKSDNPVGAEEGNPLAVRLSAGLQATTKAAVNTGTLFTAAVAGWQNTGAVDYGRTRTWLTSATVTAAQTAAEITLAQKQYYSQDGTEKTYIRAWYPQGTLTDDGTVAFAGDASYRGDGSDDVLLAGEVSGSALDNEPKTLAFKHPLTQLKFTVQGDALFGSSTTIRSITLKGAGVPTGFDLKRDAVSYDTPAAGVGVPGIDGTQRITTTQTAAGQPVMVRPYESNTFRVDVETSDVTYRDVAVTIDADASTLPGKAYTVALGFAGFEITTRANVAEWDDSGTGSGDVTTD